MQPWQFLPVHPELRQVIDTLLIMQVDDFSCLTVSSQFYHPWSAQTSMFLTLGEQVVKVKNYGENEFTTYPANFVMGPNLVERMVQCPNQHYVLGINFRPGALYRFCGISIEELVNQVVEASLIFGKAIDVLSQRIGAAKSKAEILNLVETFFFDKINKLGALNTFDTAIAKLVQAEGNIPMDEVAKLACMSEKQFERKALERLGMLPKLFARLTRFSKAYMIKETNPDISWSNIAHQCGYYDQMHLVRDFKLFSGSTPTVAKQKIQNSITAVTAFQNT
ncbi:MAG: AraC family transcriptional regulator [Pedobacter sp.]|nr:MAG: AraC family transcriptional regulator [Pedobacter sp.]